VRVRVNENSMILGIAQHCFHSQFMSCLYKMPLFL